LIQGQWVKYHDDIANATLIAKTDSWYMGSNVPGKQRRMLSFAGGVGTYHQKCEELGVLVFMHPLGTRELEPSGRLAGNGLLTNTIGNPLETTIALSHLIFEGTLDRFPGLKICGAHGAGFLPSYANRSDAVLRVFPDRVGTPPKKKPTEYLRNGQIMADTIMFTGEAVRHLIHEMGVDNVLLGTDYPFPWNTDPVDHILSIPDITDADKIKILGATAAKLLGING